MIYASFNASGDLKHLGQLLDILVLAAGISIKVIVAFFIAFIAAVVMSFRITQKATCAFDSWNNKSMNTKIVEGDLLEQRVDVIVNAWNRNIIPWWLLLPQGVSGAIKRRAGLQPFREIAKFGPIPLGEAVLTSAGKLPFLGIIHVVGINGFWRASEYSIRHSVRNAVTLAEKENFKSIAFPIIGSGSGNFSESKALELMLDELSHHNTNLKITIVRYNR